MFLSSRLTQLRPESIESLGKDINFLSNPVGDVLQIHELVVGDCVDRRISREELIIGVIVESSIPLCRSRLPQLASNVKRELITYFSLYGF